MIALGRMWRSDRGYLFVAPAMLLVVAIGLYPLLWTAWLSLHRLVLVFHQRHYIGLANYRFLLHDARFGTALGNTAYFAAVAVAVELGLGLPIALLLDSAVRSRGLIRGAVLVPWAIPTAVAAKAWALLFSPDGPLTRLLPFHPNWLGSPVYAIHAAILIDVWKTTPFMALLLLAGLQTIPSDLRQAARVDGASPLQTFFRIVLPLLWPSILLALLFRTLDAMRVFDSVFVLTEGGPANATETLSIYAFKTMMRAGDFGYGAALSWATFVLITAVSAAYLALWTRAQGARG